MNLRMIGIIQMNSHMRNVKLLTIRQNAFLHSVQIIWVILSDKKCVLGSFVG